ncbi:MAG: hypothetical protein GEU75_09270 [Dehalococcoidia bacterium]|nr:hypothetical protein [Dehalococcoidia bacterium]
MLGRPLSRRRFLAGLAALPFAIQAACSGDDAPGAVTDAPVAKDVASEARAAPPPPPFVVPEGEERRTLMAGTPQETDLYIFGSGKPGNVLMVLGGVHGNEPGGWFGAERLLDSLRPATGAFLVVPYANRLATRDFVRTTPELGDLNRLYPGDPIGLPMARMAYEITETASEFHVNHLIDMHESWAFYNDRPQNGTAFLGQTIGTNVAEPAVTLAQEVIEAVNSRILASREEFFYRNRIGSGNGPPESRRQESSSDQGGIRQAAGGSGVSSSSLGLPRALPGLSVYLVEMGQQQTLERRIALHVEVAEELARRIGILSA